MSATAWASMDCGPDSQVVHDTPIRSARIRAYRGTLPIEEAPRIPILTSDSVGGPDLHFVQYCVRSGKLFNQVAVFRSYRYKEGSEDWGTVDELGGAFQQDVSSRANCRRQDQTQSALADAGPPSDPELDANQSLSWEMRAPHASIHRAGSLPGSRRRCMFRGQSEKCGGDAARAVPRIQVPRIERTARVQGRPGFLANQTRFTASAFSCAMHCLPANADDLNISSALRIQAFEWHR